jgi:16S rRNA (guanine966-N2)-methyltransferase
MSRIISGLAGSLRLAGAAGETRPTSDRVKESVFASLESMDAINDASVLDLFAGTGALGLEAISRGAKKLVLVEKSKAAFEVCQKNLELVRVSLEKQGVSVDAKAQRTDALAFARANAESFDLVFLDPPYEFSNQKLSELMGTLRPHLKDGLVVIERSSRDEKASFEGYELEAEKTYGDTAVFFLRPISH